VTLWLPLLSFKDETALVAAASRVSVGIYPVSTLYAKAESAAQPRPVGVILGYASLTVEQIQQGIQILGDLVSRSIR
jgi:GntR family transcriptional regulator/MocR family aminotransferase